MSLDGMGVQKELDGKIERLRSLLERRGLDAVVLRRVSSFAWATCGADSHINTASSEGIASLVITLTGRYLLTNNIEASRLEQEEHLAGQGWEARVSPWYSEQDHLRQLTRGKRLGADLAFPEAVDLSADLAWLRSQLTPEEGLRFKTLSAICAEGMLQAADAIYPRMTEHHIAGLLALAVESLGVQAVVNLVATDGRVSAYRHPLPTDKPLERYAMLVLCGRKWGLVCSLTRLVHFGAIPAELRRRVEAAARVDAAMISATRPGVSMGEVFQRAQQAYSEAGFPDEWQFHHQGGLAGYEPREITATPDSIHPVEIGQAYAWNPSIAGAKSEDTLLVGKQVNEILTRIDGWPSISFRLGDQTIERPTALEK